MLNIGIIGYGYWGPNLVRNFSANEEARIAFISDQNRKALDRAENGYPNKKIRFCTDYRDVARSKEVDAVAIATPVSTHYAIAKEALQNGKHIFVEKPFTYSVKEAEDLIRLSEKKRLKIMVDHTFLFTEVVKKIKELIEKKELGEIYYYDSTRVNLGLFQHDVNVIWDLAPHDFSIMDYVIKKKPTSIVTTGTKHFDRGLEDLAYVTAYFDDNLIAHFNVNWLSPVKVRTTLIGGEKKMLVWNDLERDEKIKVYDKGVKIDSAEGLYNLLVEYRSGDMWSPRIEHTEALKRETEYFIDCVKSNKTPINDGYSGLRIVKMLEAADKSLKAKGKQVKL